MNGTEYLNIGITGHRDLREEDRDRLLKSLDEEICRLRDAHPDKQIRMFNALAAGADRLAAEYAIRSGIGLIAVLPFPAGQYEEDFSPEDRRSFGNQLEHALEVILPEKNAEQNGRDDGYRAAGRYIADHCDYLIAFWDGNPGNAEGCGTGDIAAYFMQGKGPEKLIRIDTGRREKRTLAEIRMEAENLSMFHQNAYNRCLKLLSLIGVAAVCSFLFYDELELNWLIFVYAALIALGALILSAAKKRKYHENYVNYRLLAEILRVQEVLDAAGIKRNAALYLPETLRKETDWIRQTVEDGIHGTPSEDMDKLKTSWLYEQQQYHIAAGQRTGKKQKNNERIAAVVLTLTVCVIAAACIAELIPSVDTGAFFLGRTLKNRILIATGILSAVTVFLSNYYGKQNLERKLHDHEKMAELYQNALKQNENVPLTEEVIENISREEVLENSNWYSYMKESSLTVDF